MVFSLAPNKGVKQKQRKTPAVTGTSAATSKFLHVVPFLVNSSRGKMIYFYCFDAFQEIGRERMVGGGGGWWWCWSESL